VTIEHFIDQFLSAVCDSRRRHILAYLTASSGPEASPVERSVGEIADHLGLAMSTTSEHLKQLLQMHLLLTRKEGKKTLYRIRNRELVQAFHDLIMSLEEHYHQNILSAVDKGSQ
jgi:DNA-binding transcriptional ArsR family regulator